MELMKSTIRMNQVKGMTLNQVTLENDFNVPDSKPDLRQLISRQKEVKIDAVKAQNGKVNIRGKLCFAVLYQSAGQDSFYYNLTGELPFEEAVNLDTVVDGDMINLWWEIEDFHVGMINSRKISAKAIVMLHVMNEAIYDKETAVDCLDVKPVECLKESMDITKLAVRKKDIYRLKEEVELPAVKPDIGTIIWQKMEPRNCETRLADGMILLSGDLAVCFLYRTEEPGPVQWMEQLIHFHGNLEVSGCSADMIPNIEVRMSDCSLEQKPNADGEQRLAAVDAVLELDIRIYEEGAIETLSDVYSAVRKLVPKTETAEYEHILMKNRLRTKVTGKAKLSGTDGHILQICFCTGEVKLDETEKSVDKTGGILTAEGIVQAELLCAISDDSLPVTCIQTEFPFSREIEVSGLKENSVCYVKPSIEQISATMIGSDEVEIKATVLLDVMVMDRKSRDIITEVTEEPLEIEKIQQIPGIISYLVQPEDSLWTVAKRFYTTRDSIRELNQLKSDALLPGKRIVIAKEVAGIT